MSSGSPRASVVAGVGAVGADGDPDVAADVQRERAAIGLAPQAHHRAEAHVTDGGAADRRGAERRRAALEQHHRQRQRQLHAIEERAGHVDVPDELVLDDGHRLVEARIEHAAEQRIVPVVERQPGGEVARRRVPRLLHRHEPAARRRRLVALDARSRRRAPCASTRRATASASGGERAPHQPAEQVQAHAGAAVEAEVTGVRARRAAAAMIEGPAHHAHAAAAELEVAAGVAAHAAVVRIVVAVEAGAAALQEVGPAGDGAAAAGADQARCRR